MISGSRRSRESSGSLSASSSTSPGAVEGGTPVWADVSSKAPAVGACQWSVTESMSSSMARRFSSGGGAGFAFWRFPSGSLVGVRCFLANSFTDGE